MDEGTRSHVACVATRLRARLPDGSGRMQCEDVARVFCVAALSVWQEAHPRQRLRAAARRARVAHL
jgi:hypothetical protein